MNAAAVTTQNSGFLNAYTPLLDSEYHGYGQPVPLHQSNNSGQHLAQPHLSWLPLADSSLDQSWNHQQVLNGLFQDCWQPQASKAGLQPGTTVCVQETRPQNLDAVPTTPLLDKGSDGADDVYICKCRVVFDSLNEYK